MDTASSSRPNYLRTVFRRPEGDLLKSNSIGPVRPAKVLLSISDAEEDFSSIHPEQDEPVDQHHRDAKHERFQGRSAESKDLISEMDMQAAYDEVLPQMSDQICGDRVHSDDHQRESPSPITLNVDHPG